MSAEEFVMDILGGNFTHAKERGLDYLLGTLAPELKALIKKFLTDEGKVVWAAGTQVVKEVEAGKDVVTAVQEGWAQIETQAPSMFLNDLFDAVGIQRRAQ